MVNNCVDETNNSASSNPVDSGSDDDIEVLSEHSQKTNDEKGKKEETISEPIQSGAEATCETSVEAVALPPDEELIVLSANDKAVF